ncbi:MAG: hypothetical protein RBS28_04420 [Rhodocyclaceae bacterium]|jgi:hypothetical protein|nr:hypothetical protein [Rhodocyclaceae bacterium]
MRRQRGLSKFEFAVVLAIFGILATLLLDRLVALEHDTERLEVALTLRHIDIGLKLAIGERMMRGEEARIPELLQRNPLDFLDQQKIGAGGTAGGWQYDPASRILGYRPRQPAAFDGRTRLEWRFIGHIDELGRNVGLRLEPLK